MTRSHFVYHKWKKQFKMSVCILVTKLCLSLFLWLVPIFKIDVKLWWRRSLDVYCCEWLGLLILIIMQIAHVLILMGAKDTFELQTICYILWMPFLFKCEMYVFIQMEMIFYFFFFSVLLKIFHCFTFANDNARSTRKSMRKTS